MDILSKPILVSGSSVGPLEVHYTADAAQTGWNEKCFDYIKRFEAAVCEMLGVKHAIATPSCTAALHLSLLTLGIREGDEVILPDSTWIATVNAVAYTGATPVFADICEDDWTIDPAAIERAITPRTKAVIPVHLYGHPCKMGQINAVAKEHGLYVIEDAAQSMGSLYHGAHTGSLGDMACFSFHGSKIIVMGEGGVFTTNDDLIYERAKFLGDQAKHPFIRFYNDEIGYKFRLSNLQAAFGLAQMERLEEIVAKKRQIFAWYREELDGLQDFTLNPELPGIRNNYWMVTPVIGERWGHDAAWLLSELEQRAVSGRPFFYPVSDFPMYRQFLRQPTPVAHLLHKRGLNLPCGAELTREEVHYVCAHLRCILTGREESVTVTGWLARREHFLPVKEQFKGIAFVNPDFRSMDCEISVENTAVLTEELLKSIHKETGFRRLFLTVTEDAAVEELKKIGFQEHQRIPLRELGGRQAELFRQPYAEVTGYQMIMVKVFS